MNNETRKIKVRQKWVSTYGLSWDNFIIYGIFHGWGINDNNSAIIIEIEYLREMTSSNEEANEIGNPDYSLKGKIKMLPLNLCEIIFL